MSNNYPNWNLNTLLPEIGSDEYESLIGEYKKSIEKCWTLVDSKNQIESNFCEWLNQFLQAQNELLKLENSLGAFSYINYSVDTTNTKYINNMNRLEKMGLDSSRLGIAFKKILYQNRSQLNLFFEAYTDFKNYKIILEEEIFEYEHQMSEAEELLAQEMQQTGGNAWSRLHEQIISTLADETGKTFNGLRNDAYSEDAQLRFESYKKEKSLLAANQVAFAASAIFVSIFSIYQVHARISELFAAKGIPFIINHVPIQVIQFGNTIMGAKDFIWRNRLKVIVVVWLTREGIRRLPEIPYLSAAARSIDIWKVCTRLFSSPQTIFCFALGRSLSVIGSVWNASQEIGQRFRKVSSNAEKEREIAYRQKSLGVWKSCQQVALA